MATIKFKNISVKQIRDKHKSFIDLFDCDPVIYVRGIFVDTSGNSVFLINGPAQVKKIGKTTLTLWLDSDSELINVYAPPVGAEYEFCGGQDD